MKRDFMISSLSSEYGVQREKLNKRKDTEINDEIKNRGKSAMI